MVIIVCIQNQVKQLLFTSYQALVSCFKLADPDASPPNVCGRGPFVHLNKSSSCGGRGPAHLLHWDKIKHDATSRQGYNMCIGWAHNQNHMCTVHSAHCTLCHKKGVAQTD